MVYESTFSDILGIMVFYFMIGSDGGAGNGSIALEIFLNITPPLCFIKPGFKLICSNFSDMFFYSTKVKINKIIKIIIINFSKGV